MNGLVKIILCSIILLSCKENGSNEESLPQAQLKGGNAELIRNPETADENRDTLNVAKITLDHILFDFDSIKTGKILSHRFPFVNSGNVPLIITDVRSSCGCTVPDWPKQAIEPGVSSEIVVQYNSTDKYGWQTKPVTIVSNAYPSPPELQVHGFVIGTPPKN